MTELAGVKDKIQTEITAGGELKNLPCPFCKLPRCQRGGYIRCSKCGVNWGPDDDYTVDPRIARFRKFVDEAQASMRKSGGAKAE